jgi:hypothetical protein
VIFLLFHQKCKTRNCIPEKVITKPSMDLIQKLLIDDHEVVDAEHVMNHNQDNNNRSGHGKGKEGK